MDTSSVSGHAANVIAFDPGRLREGRAAPLSSDEIARIRQALERFEVLDQEFATIRHNCPMARRLLEG